MNIIEFSNEFDIMYNNITSNQALPLDEYEKSVFLTDAQDQIIKMYFSNRLNPTREGFDDSEKRLQDFSNIIEVETMKPTSNNILVDDRAKQFEISSDKEVMFILNINLILDNKEYRTVVPMHYKEYQRIMSRPYKYPLKNQAWSILGKSKGKNLIIDIITRPNDKIKEVKARFVRQPKPIIIAALSNGLSVKGISTPTECELDEVLHREILKQAVLLAKASYLSTGQPQQQSKEQ